MGEWLEAVERESSPPPAVDPSTIVELRRELDEAISVELGRLRTGFDGPVRMPKGRVLSLQTCERKALSESRPGDARLISVPMLRGIALDRFIGHQLIAGRVLDPLGNFRSILDADGADRVVAALDALDDDAAASMLDPLATVVFDEWGDVQDRWLPRVQSSSSIVVTGADHGPVGVTSGAIDVELGGRVANLPGVLVEVKSASAAASHAAETYLYALLVSLRDGEAPAVAARWYPGTSVAATLVTTGVLESAARGLSDAYRRWVELLLGRAPQERPGRHCRWCPDADVCPSAVGTGGPADGAPGDLDDEVEYDVDAHDEEWA